MYALKARVQSGRLVLDEPTDLPDGIEVQLHFADSTEIDDDERKELYAALLEGSDELDAGQRAGLGAVIAGLETRT